MTEEERLKRRRELWDEARDADFEPHRLREINREMKKLGFKHEYAMFQLYPDFPLYISILLLVASFAILVFKSFT